MALCPGCEAALAVAASSCAKCGAVFTGDSTWQPVPETQRESDELKSLYPQRQVADVRIPSEKRSRRWPAAGIIAALGVGSVALPAIGFVLGMLLQTAIPGCHCDEGAGCHGCGIDGLVGFLVFGGFIGALLALFTALPASLLLAAIVAIFSSSSRKERES